MAAPQTLQHAYPDPRGLPTWYHGVLPRREAEQLLADNGGADGLFLLRASNRELGYVLSMQHQGVIVHYQIRQEQGQTPGAEPYLTFDTDTGVAPHFRSLASVLHHLFRNPAHLPHPLVSWVERKDLIAPMPAPRPSLAAHKHGAAAQAGRTGAGSAAATAASALPPRPTKPLLQAAAAANAAESSAPVYEAPADSSSARPAKSEDHYQQPNNGITCSLATFIKDTLAAGHAPDLALTNAQLYATAQERITQLKHAPQVQVFSAPQTGQEVFDARTGEKVLLHSGETLELVSLVRNAKKRVMVVFKDGQGRLLHVPMDSDIDVVPSDILIPSRAGSERVSGTAHAKKEDPRYDAGLGTEHEEDIEGTYQEPSQALSAVSLTPKAPDTGAKAAGPAPPATATSASGQKLPAAPRRNSSGLKRGPALAELVRSAGGQLQLSTALSEANPVFFRDVIRQGYLSKLPPPGNRIQTWRQRYFKLVVALSRSMAGGPVFLEYYADHNAKHPKGVIDLDQVVRIGKPLAATLEKGAVRAYRNVPHENLFELDMPKRCYRVLATSEAERDDWVGTLRDIMGMEGKPPPEPEEIKAGEVVCRTYHGNVLSKTLHNADGVLVLNDDSLTLTCPQTDEEVVTWEYKHLRGFGYIRQVCWVEAGRNCSSGHGVFCFSTKQAESLFETLNRLLARQHSGTNFRRRLSRRNNLSWTSLGESVLEETVKQAAALPKATEAQVIFGKQVKAEDLEPVAIGVPRAAYKAKRAEEMSFEEHDTMRVLACQTFAKQGYLLVQNAHSNAYGLVPKKLIEVHEHEFGNLRDMDDFGGSQDSIMAGLDVSAFAYPEELAKNDKADANDTYDSPNAVALKSEGEENGGGYAEPRPANQRRPLDLT